MPLVRYATSYLFILKICILLLGAHSVKGSGVLVVECLDGMDADASLLELSALDTPIFLLLILF